MKTRESTDEHYTALKALEAVSSVDIMYNVLLFLNESPLTLYAGVPRNSTERNQAFEDGFTSFIGFLAADDVRIRQLTNSVICKFINAGDVSKWRQGQSSGAKGFKTRFWKST